MSNADRLFVLTGGPGSGKSTLIAALAAQGVATSDEVGRAILREQMAVGGDALPWVNHYAFAEQMAGREIAARATALSTGQTVVLDRGVPDVAAFLRASQLAVPAHIDAAARDCRYSTHVFVAPFWAEIYVADTERRQTLAEAEAIFPVMVATYRDYGYTLIELPRVCVAERVAFVRGEIARLQGQGTTRANLEE